MPDLSFFVTLSRGQLSLSDLAINDHTNYYCAADGFLSAQTAWQRQQVTSPFLDGAVTTCRTRQMVTEPLTIEVLADFYPDMQDKLSDLIGALKQDSYIMHISMGTTDYQYQCEAADYAIMWNGPRWIAKQIQVVASIPRQPVPIGSTV